MSVTTKIIDFDKMMKIEKLASEIGEFNAA